MELEEAIASNDLTKLENAIEWAKFDGLQANLREEIYIATTIVKQLNDLGRFVMFPTTLVCHF